MLFLTCLFLAGAFDLLWWRLADARLRRAGVWWGWRWAWSAFMTLQFGSYLTLIVFRRFNAESPLPGSWLVLIYIWHVLVLPLWLVLLTISGGMGWVFRTMASWFWRLGKGAAEARPPSFDRDASKSPHHSQDPRATEIAAPTRRDLLRAGVVGIPPVAGMFTAAGALWQQEHFDVIRMNVPVAGLPVELDGLRIAHVSDPHVGKFTSQAKLRAITQAVNDLNVDLVAFTGDLIDHWMGALPDGIALVRSFRSRYGTFLVEGNHDLMENRVGFCLGVRRAGLRLLLNESAMLSIRGQKTQILGTRWGAPDSHEPLFAEHLAETLSLRDPTAFPIVLAHHPHTFDPAAAAGLPLVLCGHTHGGQIMIARDIGPARLLYKYLSGLYRRDQTSLVVSNGVGNWFPLRINAPAQLAELTLRRAKPTESTP